MPIIENPHCDAKYHKYTYYSEFITNKIPCLFCFTPLHYFV